MKKKNTVLIRTSSYQSAKMKGICLLLHLYLDTPKNQTPEILFYIIMKWGKPQWGDHNNYIIGWCAMCVFEIQTHNLWQHTVSSTSWTVKTAPCLAICDESIGWLPI